MNQSEKTRKETLIPQQRVSEPVAASFFASDEKRLKIVSAELEADPQARVTITVQRLVKGEWMHVCSVTGSGGAPPEGKGPLSLTPPYAKGEQYRVTVTPSKALTLALDVERTEAEK